MFKFQVLFLSICREKHGLFFRVLRDSHQPRGSVRLMRMMRTDTSPDADHNDLNDLNELRDIEQPRGSLKLMTTDDNDRTDDKTLETGYDSKVRRLS